jgi:hypothetical protein
VSERLLLDSFGPFGRFVSQGAFWAGSAAAVFPAIIAVPAAMLLLNDQRAAARLLAWSCLGLMMVVGFYFFSRTLWVVMIAFTALFWRVLLLRRIAFIAAVGAIGAAALLPSSRQDAPGFFNEVLRTVGLLWAPGESDAQSRVLQLEAGVNTMRSDWKTFLVGAGVYSHRFLIVPQVQELIAARYPDKADFAEPAMRNRDDPPTLIIRTTGAAALLIDTGVLGVALLLAATLAMIKKVWRSGSPHRVGMIGVLVMAPLWLIASNILDAVLLYLLMMPGGLVEQFNQEFGLGAMTGRRPALRRIPEHGSSTAPVRV